MKKQRGITLVALIITIIILLILAVVSISSVNGDGIIARANEAKTKYTQEAEVENQVLANLLSMIPDIPKEEEPNEYGFYYNRSYKCTNLRLSHLSFEADATFMVSENKQMQIISIQHIDNWEEGETRGLYDIFNSHNEFDMTPLEIGKTYEFSGTTGKVTSKYEKNNGKGKLTTVYTVDSQFVTMSKNNINIGGQMNLSIEENGRKAKLGDNEFWLQ